ncbi:LysR substrate-binding domain-containing protein [Pseudomonas capeferrum]|uniref:LysR substrate-binding domain-containing protein n=1 Tax=Pseudomonas capeferrum TaxID=1495066 RepID=UPI0030DD1CD1
MTTRKFKDTKISHLNALRAFEVSARHQSFSAAAFELDVTPAAISQLIKNLEHSLGIVLFTRAKMGSGKVTLTAAGELAYSDISVGFKLLHSGLSSLRRVTDESQLTIAVSPAFAIKWLIPKLGDFRLKHPEIEINIHMSSAPEDYISNNIDMGIRYGNGEWDGLVCEHLKDEYVFPVCSPAYQKIIGQITSPIIGVTLIHDLSLEGNLNFPTWEIWLAQNNISLHSNLKCIKINNSAAVLQTCIDSQGIALARSVMAEDDIKTGKLVNAFDTNPNKIALAYYVVYRAGFDKIKKVRFFKDWLISAAHSN